MKLTFYDSEGVLHLAAHRRLAVLYPSFPVDCVVRYLRQLLRAAVNAVVNAGKMLIADYFGALFDAKIAGISVNNFIVIPDQFGCLRNIMHIGVDAVTVMLCTNPLPASTPM